MCGIHVSLGYMVNTRRFVHNSRVERKQRRKEFELKDSLGHMTEQFLVNSEVSFREQGCLLLIIIIVVKFKCTFS